MPLPGKKIAILLAEQYEDLEFWYPYYRMKEEGADVVVLAAKGNQVYPSKHGYPAMSDLGVGQVRADQFDTIVIPGGFAPDFMRRDDATVEFVRQATKSNVLIAAICHGVWMLCCTDALKGKRCTSYSSIRYDVQNAGGKWVDQPCVMEGNIITSRCPDDLPVFVREIIGALSLAYANVSE